MTNFDDDKQKKGTVTETAPSEPTKPLNPHDTTKRKIKFTDNSAQNQRLKLLDWLLEKNSITTTQARTNLDIMSPAARILELKRHGYLINTVPAEWVSEHGINHKGVARYVLTQKQPIEAVNQCEVA